MDQGDEFVVLLRSAGPALGLSPLQLAGLLEIPVTRLEAWKAGTITPSLGARIDAVDRINAEVHRRAGEAE